MKFAPFFCCFLLFSGASLTADDDVGKCAPGVREKGRVLSWTADNGISFRYQVPATYDPEEGANLVFILHDRNLDSSWGFSKHNPEVFRSDDILVCPDGTTPNRIGGFTYRFADRDLKKFQEMHRSLLAVWNVRSTFLYGHGDGAAFAFAYAGTEPRFVQGVVGHSGRVWEGTPTGKDNHHQTIALLHGDEDREEPLASSFEAQRLFLDHGYPFVHMRTLVDQGHEANPAQVDQLLSWCEGMSTDHLERLEFVVQSLMERDDVNPVALYELARKISAKRKADPELKARAIQYVKTMNDRVERHVQMIEKGMKRFRGKLEKKPWIGQMHLFLADFEGIPAVAEFRERHADILEEHDRKAAEAAQKYHSLRETNVPKAFVAGVDLVGRGFLAPNHVNEDLLEQLEEWKENSRELGISRADTRYFDKIVPLFRGALEAGRKSYQSVE